MQEAISKKIIELSQREQALTSQYLDLIGRAEMVNRELAKVQHTLRALKDLTQAAGKADQPPAEPPLKPEKEFDEPPETI